jgi:hypothetical protein
VTHQEYTKWLQRFQEATETHEVDPTRILELQVGLATLRYVESVEQRDCRKFDRNWLEGEFAMLLASSRSKR